MHTKHLTEMYMYRVHSAYHMYMQSQMQIHVKMSITFGGKLHYQASSKKKKGKRVKKYKISKFGTEVEVKMCTWTVN